MTDILTDKDLADIARLSECPGPITRDQFMEYVARQCKMSVGQIKKFGLDAYKCFCSNTHCLGWLLADKANMEKK